MRPVPTLYMANTRTDPVVSGFIWNLRLLVASGVRQTLRHVFAMTIPGYANEAIILIPDIYSFNRMARADVT